MPKCALLAVLLGVGAGAPHGVEGQQHPVQIAFANPQPHFVAAWAPTKEREAERAAVLGRRVSLDLSDVPLDAALKVLTSQAGLRMTYSPAVLPKGRRVTIRARDVAVVTALTEMLFRSGVDVVVDREGGMALVRCRHAVAEQPPASQDSGAVAGRVTDKRTGAPIVGATVVMTSTGIHASTDNDGRYRLVPVPSGDHTLQIRFIGYIPSSVVVTVTADGEVTADVTLERSAQQLQQVVVTGTVMPTERKAIPTPITVITADDIQEQDIHHIDQLFRGQLPGAVSWDLSADNYFSQISIRGANSLFLPNTVKTFIDGIEVANPAYLSTIDPSSVERVEVTRGPQASTLYGPGASGGVMQIFTKKGRLGLKRPELSVKLASGLIEPTGKSGSAIQQDYGATVAGGTPNASYNIGGSYLRIGEWAPSYRSTDWGAFGGAQTTQGPLTLGLSARYSSKGFDDPWRPALRQAGYIASSRPTNLVNAIDQQTYGAMMTLAATPRWDHSLRIGYDRTQQGYFRSRPQLTTPADTFLWVYSGEERKTFAAYSTGLHLPLGATNSVQVTGGLDHYSYGSSSVFTSQATHTDGNIDGFSSPARTTFENTGYFGQVEADLGGTAFLTAGLRADDNQNFGNAYGLAVAPRVGVSYVAQRGAVQVKLRGSWGEGLRAPGPEQRRASVTGFQNQLANPLLGPERQRGFDAGLEVYIGTRWSIGATYFNQMAIELIDFVLLDGGSNPPTFQFQNVGRIRNTGLELEGRLTTGALGVSGTYTITNSTIRKLSPAYSGDYRVGDRILGIPRTVAGIRVHYDVFRNTGLNAQLTHIGAWTGNDQVALFGFYYGESPYRGSGRDYWIRYPTINKIDIGLTQRVGQRLTAFANATNVGNQRRFQPDNNSVPMGRVTTVGLRLGY